MIEETGISNYKFTNWSETFSCNPERYFVPENVEQLREIILFAKENKKNIRVAGCRKSPSDIVCTDNYLISIKNLNKVLKVDVLQKTVKVEAGITIKELNPILESNNLAFSVLGSISDITIGGAISIAFHGTGLNFNVFSNYIKELELLTSSGDLIKCSRKENYEIFLSALCGLGAIGIIINVTIQCEKAFMLHQFTRVISLDEIIDNVFDFLGSEHVRFLWFPYTNNTLACYNNRIYNSKPTKYTLIERFSNFIINYAIGYYALEFSYWISSFIPQLVPYINKFFFKFVYSQQNEKVDVSYKIFEFECLFRQYVNEWSIPIENTSFVLLQLRRFIETRKDIFVHFPIEIRFVKGDDIYLSPAFGRDSCYINIIMYRPYKKDIECKKYWNFFEKIMKESGGRPHWAKAHNENASDFIKMYPCFRSWLHIKKRVDPISMFNNSYMDRIFSSPINL